MNLGKFLKAEMEKEYFVKYLKDKQEYLYTQLDVFKEMSNLFEEYANLLKLLKKSNKDLQKFLSTSMISSKASSKLSFSVSHTITPALESSHLVLKLIG